MKTITRFLLLPSLAAFLNTAAVVHALNLDFVTIGNPGNPNDTSTGYGDVSYEYEIGTYEVTLTQYTAFLNAVGATDTFGLYNPSMGTDLNIAGIARSGGDGSFTYSVIGSGNRPVTYVSWFDAARYCNWLHNRLPSGTQNASTTEDGAYTLNGATSDGLAISKNAVATYWIPSENEWYKAAYYQPTAAGGDSDGYWLYPTRSNSVPGNVIGTTANQANYYTTVYSVTQSDSYIGIQNYLTDRGAYSGSASHYGTFDQGGNVWEWNDAVIGVVRGLRGNSWSVWPSATELQSSHRGYSDPTYEVNYIGFRVARLPDTDGDGIADQFETGTGIYVSPENTGTSPTNPDTDGDGLTDGAEVYTHQSSPNLRDTDGDGFEDGFEVSTGFSPTSATSTPDALSSIRTAAEYRFNAALGISYRIEASTDLANWQTIET
ncbi:MAG TPA: SUMF1/EgtB/PvdO family nonheme iron enzyme, partial [Chthoniobacteraceae bacterium]|nr:SUMF1/EgtB/PvdO family nonheme iron enzyme [Chthoniobacteraceae bacterium]